MALYGGRRGKNFLLNNESTVCGRYMIQPQLRTNIIYRKSENKKDVPVGKLNADIISEGTITIVGPQGPKGAPGKDGLNGNTVSQLVPMHEKPIPIRTQQSIAQQGQFIVLKANSLFSKVSETNQNSIIYDDEEKLLSSMEGAGIFSSQTWEKDHDKNGNLIHNKDGKPKYKKVTEYFNNPYDRVSIANNISAYSEKVIIDKHKRWFYVGENCPAVFRNSLRLKPGLYYALTKEILLPLGRKTGTIGLGFDYYIDDNDNYECATITDYAHVWGEIAQVDYTYPPNADVIIKLKNSTAILKVKKERLEPDSQGNKWIEFYTDGSGGNSGVVGYSVSPIATIKTARSEDGWPFSWLARPIESDTVAQDFIDAIPENNKYTQIVKRDIPDGLLPVTLFHTITGDQRYELLGTYINKHQYVSGYGQQCIGVKKSSNGEEIIAICPLATSVAALSEMICLSKNENGIITLRKEPRNGESFLWYSTKFPFSWESPDKDPFLDNINERILDYLFWSNVPDLEYQIEAELSYS